MEKVVIELLHTYWDTTKRDWLLEHQGGIVRPDRMAAVRPKAAIEISDFDGFE